MDTSRERRRNKRWPEALKREIVAATLVPGASVSVVARQHNVNANQVFGWRRRYGEASEPLGCPPSTSGLVPVTITPEPENEGGASPTPTTSETIEIEIGGDCRIRDRGRDASYLAPPAQNRTGPIRAYGSHLG